MKINMNNRSYGIRANSEIQQKLFIKRANTYRKKIVPTILSALGGEKLSGEIMDLGGGPGNKAKILLEEIICKVNGILYFIEPCTENLQLAKTNLSNHSNIKFIQKSSLNLKEYENLSAIFCNQMTHHLDEEAKKQLFEDAYNSLDYTGKLFILDTTFPKQIFLKIIFKVLAKLYKKTVGKGNHYYNISKVEYINLLESVGFEIDIEHTKHFYNLGKVGELLTNYGILYPFMTQIIATKK